MSPDDTALPLADRLHQGPPLPVDLVASLPVGLTPSLAAASTTTTEDSSSTTSFSSEATIATVLAWCARLRFRPGAMAVLMAVASGADSTRDIAALTGLPATTIRTGLRRCTGRGRMHSGRIVQGTGQALIHTRPHPHLGPGAQQLLLTAQGRTVVAALMGDANALG